MHNGCNCFFYRYLNNKRIPRTTITKPTNFFNITIRTNAIKDILDGYIENAELAKGFMTELKESGINEDTLTTAIRNAADQFKLPENDVIKGQRKRIAEQQEQLVEKEAKIQELLTWKREHMARNVKAVVGSGKMSNDGVNNVVTSGTIPTDKVTKRAPAKTKRTSTKKKTDEK